MNKTVAYMRVSTHKQEQDRQKMLIMEYATKNGIKITEWYQDVITGKIINRPEYARMKNELESGDTVIVTELERLGRDWDNNQTEYKWYIENGINLTFIDFPMISIEHDKLNQSLEQRFIKEMLVASACYFAQKEREKISQRTKDGLLATKKKGTNLGRPRAYDNLAKAVEFWLLNNENYSQYEVAKMYGVKYGTIRTYISRNNLSTRENTRAEIIAYFEQLRKEVKENKENLELKKETS